MTTCEQQPLSRFGRPGLRGESHAGCRGLRSGMRPTAAVATPRPKWQHARMRLAHRTLGLACALVLVGAGVVSCSDASGRRLLWHDEFDGPAGAFPDSRIWSAQFGAGGWGNGELQTYTDRPENVALDGKGHLVLSARSSGPPEGTASWTSARINTSGKHAIRYGR